MGHPRHGHAYIGVSLEKEGIQQSGKSLLNLSRCIDHEQAKVGSHEFVAAAAGMQFPANCAEFFDQRFLYEMVYVFGVHAEPIKPRGIGPRELLDFVECGERLLYFGGGENADTLQCLGPGAIDGKFIGQETAIERERTLERVELLVRLAVEAAAPQAVVFALG